MLQLVFTLCFLIHTATAAIEPEPLFTRPDGKPVPRHVFVENVMPFLTAADVANFAPVSHEANVVTYDHIQNIKANKAFEGLSDEAQTCLAQLIVKKGSRPNHATGRYRLDYKRAYQAYVHACNTYPDDEEIQNACLDLVRAQIVSYQQPFLDALRTANEMITKQNLQELFDAITDPLLKMAVRVMWRYKTVANPLDGLTMNEIFSVVKGYNRKYIQLNFTTLTAQNSTIIQKATQLIIDLTTTLIDNAQEPLELDIISLPPTYRIPKITSWKLRKLNVSDNNLIMLLGIICPNLVRLDAEGNDRLKLPAIKAFKKAKHPELVLLT